MFQIGRFLLAKNVKFGEREDFMYMKDVIEAEDQTQTPAFKRWFGNSKVVDDDGKPLVVYHGTGADIRKFDQSKQDIRDSGFWFGSKEDAGGYAYREDGGNIMPVYLSIANPKIYFNRDVKITPELIKKLKAQGFDGVKRDFAKGPDAWRYGKDAAPEWAAFDDTQIKSAIGNIGTYDPTSPDITRMKDRIEREATTDLKNIADDHAEDFRGDVIYQNGEIGLVRAFNAWNGRAVYIPFKGASRARVDIDAFKGTSISSAQIQELVDAKKNWIAKEEEKEKTDPFVQYDKDGVAVSQSVTEDFAGVIAGWKKMLGLKTNIYITTMDDARANRLNLIGNFSSVAGSSIDPNNAGVAQRLPNGDYFIAYTKKTSRVRMLEIAAHELGHIHEKEVFNNESQETKDAIKAAFSDWLKSTKGMSAAEYVQELRARATGKTTKTVDVPIEDLKNYTGYWSSFTEWYADQVSKWATTQQKPLTVVEKFFSKLGAAMRAFYSKLRGSKYLPNETFRKYLDRVTDAAVDSTSNPTMQTPFVSDQMEMNFMKDSMKERVQEVLQTRAPMNVAAFEGLDESTIDDISKNFFAPNLTIIDRMEQNKGRAFEWLAQKTVDEFRSAKTYSPMGHMQAT